MSQETINLDENYNRLKTTVQRALDEDLGGGDVTTLCTVSPESELEGRFLAKEAGVIAGLRVAELAFLLVDERVVFKSHAAEGDRVAAQTAFATVTGSGRALLSAERTALNFLQRLSGIASLTRRFV